jgi:anaerobic magnesium-protoporphyrin IX monomethyl ester cyclase
VAQKDTGKRITSFQAHRGCPYTCTFCADGQRVMGRHAMISRPVADLLNEIESVTAEYHLDYFKFCDATWNASQSWVKEFCREKIKRRNHLPFFANVHANPTGMEMFDLMHEAGCAEVGMGVESGSPEILKSCKKQATRKTIVQAVRYAHLADIKVRGYFLIGLPGETNETLKDTEEFAADLNLDEYGFTIFCPYPGTAVYKADPTRFKDVAWQETDEYSNDFWYTTALRNADLKSWQSRLVTKFHDRATWHNRVMEDGGAK